MDWNDLRYLLAVARVGSVAAAAKSLGVSHSTVYRRIKAFEDAQRLTLFERHADGYRLTEAGRAFVTHATSVETAVANVERNLRRYGNDVSGTVSIAAPEAAALAVCPRLEPLLSRFPRLTLDWQLDADADSLLRRETDVAIVAALEPPPALVGRRLTNIRFAVFGARDALEALGLEEHSLKEARTRGARWIVFDPSLVSPVAAWEQQNVPADGVAMRVNRRVMLDEAIIGGLGIGVMPRLTGDAHPHLSRLSDDLDIELPLWVLTHPDLRESPAVRAVVDEVFELLGAERQRLEAVDFEEE